MHKQAALRCGKYVGLLELKCSLDRASSNGLWVTSVDHIPPGYPHRIGYMSYYDCFGFLQKYIWELLSLKLNYILCRKNKN
jgi:hypothetical protein